MADEVQDTVDEIKETRKKVFEGAGGTPGGTMLFNVGLVLTAVGLWMLLSNVMLTTMYSGWISRGLQTIVVGAGIPTTYNFSAVCFVPFFLGVVILFYNSKWKLGWVLFWSGLAITVIEILSRLQPVMQISLAHLLLILALIAAGVGCMLRGLRDYSKTDSTAE